MNRLLLTGISVIGLSAFLLGCQGEQSVAQKTTSIVPISTTQADKNMVETEDINAELDAWFETKFMEGVRQYPQFLAQLGIKERTDAVSYTHLTLPTIYSV